MVVLCAILYISNHCNYLSFWELLLPGRSVMKVSSIGIIIRGRKTRLELLLCAGIDLGPRGVG
jgi:hypothetical protein